jgi:hypothetical protein
VLGKPSGWVSYTYSLGAANGPFGFGVIDTWSVGRRDLEYRYYAVTGSDHMSGGSPPGALFLAASNHPVTGWAYLNSGNPILDSDDLESGDGTQLEAALFIDYNPFIDRFVIYPHSEGFTGPTGTEQVTGRIVTADFETWTPEGAAGAASYVVISGQGDHHGYATRVRNESNLILFHRCHGADGLLEGASQAVDKAGSQFLPLDNFKRPGAIQAVLDDPQSLLLGSHVPFKLGGRWWGIYNVRPSAAYSGGTRADSLYLAPLADDVWTITGPPVEIVALGGSGAIDQASINVPDVLVTEKAVYVYYSAIANDSPNWSQVIACARCRIRQDGSYET